MMKQREKPRWAGKMNEATPPPGLIVVPIPKATLLLTFEE
jgi:hypothetical protein